jgi:hypothetical protein
LWLSLPLWITHSQTVLAKQLTMMYTYCIYYQAINIISIGSFWGSGAENQIYSGGIFPFGGLPNSNLTPGLLPIFGPNGPFWDSGAQNQFLFRRLLPIVTDPNSNLSSGLRPSLGPNSNFTPGLLPIFGPTKFFWGSGVQNQILFRGFYSSLGSRTLIWPLGFCPSLGPNSNLNSEAFAHSQVPDQGSTVDNREQVRHSEPRIGRHGLHSAQEFHRATSTDLSCATSSIRIELVASAGLPRIKFDFRPLNPKRQQWAPKWTKAPQ